MNSNSRDALCKALKEIAEMAMAGAVSIPDYDSKSDKLCRIIELTIAQLQSDETIP